LSEGLVPLRFAQRDWKQYSSILLEVCFDSVGPFC
jgi:hypothetical protein